MRCLRIRRQIPHLHVLGHPLSKKREKLLCDMKVLQAPSECQKRTSSGIQEDQAVAPDLDASRYREVV
jgi:hypothetical protein